MIAHPFLLNPLENSDVVLSSRLFMGTKQILVYKRVCFSISSNAETQGLKPSPQGTGKMCSCVSFTEWFLF
jgi:hypothetical protein